MAGKTNEECGHRHLGWEDGYPGHAPLGWRKEKRMFEPEAPRRPYAATANVLAVLERARTRNLPPVIDNDYLRLVGVSDIVYGRVMEALRFLGLIEADQAPSSTLRALASASEAEYKQLLGGSGRAAYAEDFTRLNPELDGQSQVLDAFRRYEPRSQTNRMVMLFLGLCRAAGVPVKDAPREQQISPRVISRTPNRYQT